MTVFVEARVSVLVILALLVLLVFVEACVSSAARSVALTTAQSPRVSATPP